MHANHPIEEQHIVLPAARALPARGAALLRNLDVVLLGVAAAPALLLGAPAIGFCLGAGGWLLQRLVHRADRVWVMRAGEATQALGRNMVESFGRIWLLAGAIVAAALLGGRADGLAAALTIFCVYSVAFAQRLGAGRPGRESTR
jgi:hypothetical protein